ncbi:T9SS type A sorting domain-containing protein [Mariniflexile aquimaris]|uniref:T9SS type A sorting domain-containing protein n=1 Tax=Mariniflexile aquimaris TaxID=881009 RepID=A0ABW3BR99_9FLAO
MKKTLLSFGLLATSLIFAQSQQVIGEFPTMDGGMEAQTATTTIPGMSSNSANNFTEWTVSGTSATSIGKRSIINNAATARTGNKFGVIALASDPATTSTNCRLQAPANPTGNLLQYNQDYVVQFYYKTSVDPSILGENGENVVTGALYPGGVSYGSANTRSTTAHIADTWVKYTEIVSGVTPGSSTNTNTASFASVRLAVATTKTYSADVNVDDFVVYTGNTIDNTAPNAATAGTYNTSGTIGWTAPSGGVDGGGYVVVKYASMPAANDDPNQNGIYQVGNTVTGSVSGTVVYIGTATTFNDTYTSGTYYKIYAVDKAFNYADELIVSDATLGISKNQIEGLNIYPNPAKDYITVESKSVKISSVAMYNLLGAQVISEKALINSRLNVSGLAKGIYMLKVNAEGASTTKKIVIE